MKETFLPEEAPMDEPDFKQKLTKDTRRKAAWAELIVAADCLGRGYTIAHPYRHRRYDLVVDVDGDLKRVQVSLGSKGPTLRAALGRSQYRFDYTRNRYLSSATTQYLQGEFDVLAVVDRVTSEVYYIPADEIDFSSPTFTVKAADKDRYRDL